MSSCAVYAAGGDVMAHGDVRPPAARAVADTAFQKEDWGKAEKAYVAYSRQMPPPKDVSDALVRVAVCRNQMKDSTGALRVLGQVFSDVSVTKREPDALAVWIRQMPSRSAGDAPRTRGS